MHIEETRYQPDLGLSDDTLILKGKGNHKP